MVGVGILGFHWVIKNYPCTIEQYLMGIKFILLLKFSIFDLG